MSQLPVYKPKYSNSRALVIGIDKYAHASPLSYARSDASAVAQVLTEKLGFQAANVLFLKDQDATREAISTAFLGFASPELAVDTDERLLVFFAGHGHTVRGRRGETGFLVPFDGNLSDLATLIRWDELTRNADLIPAKHVLFLMDACYGGLALSRKPLPPGTARFLKDMLQRYSRQVLTAGKADETVADSGGPRPEHSVFTGHLLDALEGAAATSDGILTANSVMAYVYDRVSRDQQSRQTPHFGFLDGDGDFILAAPPLEALQQDTATDKDILVKIPHAGPILLEPDSVADVVKDLIASPSAQIRLDDYISSHVRKFLELSSLTAFPVQGHTPDKDAFLARLKEYEDVSRDLETIIMLLARWGDALQLPLLEKVLARVAESDKGSAGTVLWLKLGWYPCLRLMYAGGIAALSARRYDSLAVALTTPVISSRSDERIPLVVAAIGPLTDIIDSFKWIPGHERHYVSRSEYLLKSLQPSLEDLLFLGQAYEALFDEFEVLLTLSYASLTQHGWGPPGRFAWKHSGIRHGGGPYRRMFADAQKLGDQWPPFKAGVFSGSSKDFLEMATKYQEQLDRLGWW